MEYRLQHPEVLADFNAAPARRVRFWVWFCLSLWLVLVVADWAMRLMVFRWQDQWIIRKTVQTETVAAAPAAAPQRTVPAVRGAGLTQMVPLAGLADRYAEDHPSYIEYRDDHGYFNPPLPAGRTYDVVMLGDSFMLSLGTQHVAQVLAEVSGHGVYNHAMYGAGPFLEMIKFIGSSRFTPPPKVVIWNLTARELGAALFLRQPVEAWFAGVDPWADYKQKIARSRIRWNLLKPVELRRAWPNTSFAAYFARNAWAKIQLLVFREWPRDVLGAEDPQYGPMLFYRENLRALPKLSPERDAPGVLSTVRKMADGFRGQGMQLVVLLVPEKEQVHMAALPPADQQALTRGAELLAAIEAGLKTSGIPVVNLLPVFQDTTARGTRLYWRDDTHWNDAGIRLAAEELWRVVEPLLK